MYIYNWHIHVDYGVICASISTVLKYWAYKIGQTVVALILIVIFAKIILKWNCRSSR